FERSTPSTTTWPEFSLSSPPRILISVVLPEPDGPMSATHSAVFTLKLRSSIARSAPYFLTRFSIATCGAAVFWSGRIWTGVLTLHLEKRKRGERWRAGGAGTR